MLTGLVLLCGQQPVRRSAGRCRWRRTTSATVDSPPQHMTCGVSRVRVAGSRTSAPKPGSPSFHCPRAKPALWVEDVYVPIRSSRGPRLLAQLVGHLRELHGRGLVTLDDRGLDPTAPDNGWGAEVGSTLTLRAAVGLAAPDHQDCHARTAATRTTSSSC